jgi:hypothetical protein
VTARANVHHELGDRPVACLCPRPTVPVRRSGSGPPYCSAFAGLRRAGGEAEPRTSFGGS